MRELMNEEIAATTLSGRTLDVGGGLAASYDHLLHIDGRRYSVNIASSMRPSIIADLGAALPFTSDTFDAVISFNTLEHLPDDQFALDEMVRVLRPGGTLFILVPFLYRVHADPDDFHRHTASGWRWMLDRAGIPPANQTIVPLVWDPLSTAWAIADIAPLGRNWWRARRFLRPVVLGRPLVMHPIDRREKQDPGPIIDDFALAYSIKATK